MTYITAQPQLADSWDEICYPVGPVFLTDLLPDYDIIATDRQKLIVGQPFEGRKIVFGIQSAEYVIIPNALIRNVVDKLFTNYTLQIKHTLTGEFSITIILPQELSIGGERLHRSMILTNSYNGKTPFSIQGQALSTIAETGSAQGSSLYRGLCKNGLMGWADPFYELKNYQEWLKKSPGTVSKRPTMSNAKAKKSEPQKGPKLRKIHHSGLTPELFQGQLNDLLLAYSRQKPSLTTTVYEHLQERSLGRADENILRSLPVPVQLAKQAHERLRLEQRMLGVNTSSYWLMYNAVNHALFNARSSLTLNDRYKLDEQVFHQLAARAWA